MKRYKYTVVGGGAMVQMLKFHSLPRVGKTAVPINPDPDRLYYGGCGFNVYSGLAKLGVPVLPVMTHAHPLMAARLHSDCQKYGCSEAGVFGPEKEHYYHCLMMGDDQGDHITIAYWYGKDVENAQHQKEPVCLQDAFFADSEMALLVLGSPELSPQTVDLAKRNGVPLAYSFRNDPVLVPDDILRKILGETSILFTNEVEARAIAGQLGLDHITDLFRTAKADIIVTTLGSKGSVVYDKGHGRHFEETVVPITCTKTGSVDAVGAGDAFVAGFMYGIAQGRAPAVCAQYGSTAASFVIEKDGSTTNLPTAEELLARNAQRPDADNWPNDRET